jgi:MYXO-CTERM domain-containing protein
MRRWSMTMLTLALALWFGRDAGAYCLDKYQGMTDWASWASQPVKYRVSTSLTDALVVAAIDKAFASWSAVNCTKLSFSKEAQFAMASVPFKTDTGHINIYWATKASEFPTGVDPKNMYYFFRSFNATGQVTGASVAVNAFTYAWNSTGGDGSTFDVQNVMTHLVGKVLGFKDSTVAGAVMYPDVTFGQTSKRTLTADDIAGLQVLYPDPSCPAPPQPGANGCSTGTTPATDGGVAPATDGGTKPAPDGGVNPPAGDGTSPPQGDSGGMPPAQDGSMPTGDSGGGTGGGGEDDEGCSCELGGPAARAPLPLFLVGLVGLVLLARRRRTR